MRTSYDSLSTKLALAVNEMRHPHLQDVCSTHEYGEGVAELVYQVLAELSTWTIRIQDTMAWKYTYPLSDQVRTIPATVRRSWTLSPTDSLKFNI